MNNTPYIKNFIRDIVNFPMAILGLQIIKTNTKFIEDGLHTIHNHDFTRDKSFIDTIDYVSKLIGHQKNKMRFRTYVAIKLAEFAIKISPTFCECGVGDGIIQLSILKYFKTKRIRSPELWLFDTFSGLDENLVSKEETHTWGISAKERKHQYKSEYNSNLLKIKNNFSNLSKKVIFIEGSVPDTLTEKTIREMSHPNPISFLHIDMNNAIPEVAAFEKLLPNMAHGGIILLDDYAYSGYEYQKHAIDNLCNKLNLPCPIVLPTGQGLYINYNFNLK